MNGFTDDQLLTILIYIEFALGMLISLLIIRVYR